MPSAVCMIVIMVSFAITIRTLPHPRRRRKGIFFILAALVIPTCEDASPILRVVAKPVQLAAQIHSDWMKSRKCRMRWLLSRWNSKCSKSFRF